MAIRQACRRCRSTVVFPSHQHVLKVLCIIDIVHRVGATLVQVVVVVHVRQAQALYGRGKRRGRGRGRGGAREG